MSNIMTMSRTKPRKQLSQQDYYKDDPKAKELCSALEKNALDFGLHLFSLNDKRQGKSCVACECRYPANSITRFQESCMLSRLNKASL